MEARFTKFTGKLETVTYCTGTIRLTRSINQESLNTNVSMHCTSIRLFRDMSLIVFSCVALQLLITSEIVQTCTYAQDTLHKMQYVAVCSMQYALCMQLSM